MAAGKTRETWAFLSIAQFPDFGFCGGLLLLQDNGRPLEFHCTTPIRLSRTQEILFGNSLETTIFSERIGPALCGKLKQAPNAIFVNSPTGLAVRTCSESPVAYIRESAGTIQTVSIAGNTESTPSDANQVVRPEPSLFSSHVQSPQASKLVGRYEIRSHFEFENDIEKIEPIIHGLAWFDFCEPFERIREALEEAQRAARAAAA